MMRRARSLKPLSPGAVALLLNAGFNHLSIDSLQRHRAMSPEEAAEWSRQVRRRAAEDGIYICALGGVRDLSRILGKRS